MDEKLSVPFAQQKRSKLMLIARTFGRLFDIAAQMIIGAWSVVRRSITVLLILGLLASNVATIASGAFQQLVSTSFELATGIAAASTALRKQAAANKAQLVAERAKSARLATTVKKQTTALWNATAALHRSRTAIIVQGQNAAKFAARSREIRRIAQRVYQRTIKSAALNVESLVPRAVPIAGVALAVGVTAAGLKWDCDTMKDMKALDVALDEASDTNGLKMDGAPVICGKKIPTTEEVWAEIGSVSDWTSATTKEAIRSVKAQMQNISDFELLELKLPW